MAATTTRAFEQRQTAVDEAEAAWVAFLERDDRDGLEQRLDNLNGRRSQTGARLDQLEDWIRRHNTEACG